MQPIKTIVFDIGGVLVRLGDFPIKEDWLSESTPADYDGGRWLKSDLGQAFETGAISAAEFADRFIRTHDLQVSPAEFLTHFRQWPVGLFDGIPELLGSLQHQYRLSVFSNTNELHWDRLMNEMGLARYIDAPFASHLLGFAKPEPTAFSRIAGMLGEEPQHCLFIDDNQSNVEGALAAGFQADIAQGYDELVKILGNYGISPLHNNQG